MPYDAPENLSHYNRGAELAAYNGTFTASDHVATETASHRFMLARACKVLGGVFTVTTAGVSKVPKICVMQSTNTGVVIAPSHTLGASAVGTLSTTATYTAGEVATINIIHTGTASAAEAAPAGRLALDIQDQYS